MGQLRTALIFGADLTGIELPEEYWDHASRRGADPEGTESGVLGYPVAVAYDPDADDCAEIEFPVDLLQVEASLANELAVARRKWRTFQASILERFGIVIPDGRLLLDEVERA